MISLQLFPRLTSSFTAGHMDLTHHARDWARTIRATGGFWLGDFTISGDTMSMHKMRRFFRNYLGWRVVEWTGGKLSWEGEIVEMTLTSPEETSTMSLDLELWHNKVKVAYTDDATAVATATAWSENTGSSNIWGESNYIDVVADNYDSTAATALRDRKLIERAYPRSIPSGGLASRQKGSGTGLHVIVAGDVFGMNRRYRESDTAAANVSAQISTLVGESEFVSAGYIEENTLQVPIKGSEIPFRLWDGIEEMIAMGDANGNKWVGGVYESQQFTYKQAETAVTHYWDGALRNLSGRRVLPSLMRPDIVVQRTTDPVALFPPGTSLAQNNPRNIYIAEVEFIAPDRYRLMPDRRS